MGDRFVHRAIWWQCLTAEQKLVLPFWSYCCAWFGNHRLESSRVLHFFLEKNKKARLLNFDRCILGSEREMGLVLIPYYRSFFTRIPHPEIHSSLSRISLSSGSRTSVENFLDQHLSKALISLVPDLHYLLFSEKGALLSLSLLFSQPITNLLCNRCRFSGKSQISQILYSVNVSRIQRCFWVNPWPQEYPSTRPGKSHNQHPLTYRLHIQQRQVKLCITISVKVNFVTKYAWNRMKLN